MSQTICLIIVLVAPAVAMTTTELKTQWWKCDGKLSGYGIEDCKRMGKVPGCYFVEGFDQFRSCAGRCNDIVVGSIDEEKCNGSCPSYLQDADAGCKKVDTLTPTTTTPTTTTPTTTALATTSPTAVTPTSDPNIAAELSKLKQTISYLVAGVVVLAVALLVTIIAVIFIAFLVRKLRNSGNQRGNARVRGPGIEMEVLRVEEQ